MTLSEMLAGATKRPWRWIVSLESKQVRLEGSPGRGCEYVMSFDRWGMSSAAPSFRVDGLLVHTKDLTAKVPGREHHEKWYRDIDHPDAQLIVHAVNTLEARSRVCEAAQAVMTQEDSGVCNGRTTYFNELRSRIASLELTLAHIAGSTLHVESSDGTIEEHVARKMLEIEHWKEQASHFATIAAHYLFDPERVRQSEAEPARGDFVMWDDLKAELQSARERKETR